MIQVYKVDSDGYYLEPVLIKDNEPVPSNCTILNPNQFGSFIKGKLSADKMSWAEGATQEEIDALKNVPLPLDPFIEMQKQQSDLIMALLMKGVL